MIISIGSNISSSLQAGDLLYYQGVNTFVDATGATIRLGQETPIFIGYVEAYTSNSVLVANPEANPFDSGYDEVFLMFAKRANKSKLKGYFMSVEMTNDRLDRAELFAVSSEVTESSK